MGPLSAIGDTLFPATLRILATSLVITMAAAGNVFAPILFLLIYNIPNYLAMNVQPEIWLQHGNGI